MSNVADPLIPVVPAAAAAGGTTTGVVEPPDPSAIVIFGATGDLSGRKLIPALYNLFLDQHLPEAMTIVGVGRSGDRKSLATTLRAAAEEHSRRPPSAETWDSFARRIDYVAGDFGSAETYAAIRERLAAAASHEGTRGNTLYYLATPPSLFSVIIEQLSLAGLIAPPGEKPWTRVVIEKPIGRDLASAIELSDLVARHLDERQVFRIDHYLGKETVQNILVFRFANTIFEPIWNRKYVDRIEITAAETVGVEHRGQFYDRTGVLRDMVQNHLLQVLALCAMEPPVSFRADDIRDRKTEVWRSLRPLEGTAVARDVVRAQYRGYHDEPDVAPDSRTPTFVALRMFVDNWRWQGVPFYLRAGKKMRERVTEVAIHFQTIPLCLFDDPAACQMTSNVLTLRIQPEEGISLRFAAKTPGEGTDVANILMDMKYRTTFGAQISEAYERLLLDAMRGDATLFSRRDGVERAWGFITPILEAWDADRTTAVSRYDPGSDGPAEATALLARHGHDWKPLAAS
jgi:glucose-6-phosphate 1-dehydrogenase